MPHLGCLVGSYEGSTAMRNRICIDRIVRVGVNRYIFDVSIAIGETDKLTVRACALVQNRSGAYIVYPPSRWTGEWLELVGMPKWLLAAIREAALRSLDQAEAVQ